MAKAIQTVTLSVARGIPFNQLRLSHHNVRKTKAGISIEELAADIATRGLLSSLNVRPEVGENGSETGLYVIPAGGRRYRALELLVSQKRLAKDALVPCIVSRGETLEAEDSLAENVQRIQLHPLDQYRAFQSMREQGLDDAAIAARFFVSIATVKQRLRLASVSPRLLELYADDAISLEQVIAFSITDDHSRQEQVWESVSRSHAREAYHIRRLLTETTIAANDRRALYVGLDTYQSAGGAIMHDLFDDDSAGWLQDAALLERLLLDKLSAEAEQLKLVEGWRWVEAAVSFPYGHSAELRRLHGEPAEMTEQELARHDQLRAEHDRLDADYSQASDYCEATETRLEEIGSELDSLNDRPLVFDAEDIARGGVFIALAPNGQLKIERGFVRPEDEAQADAQRPPQTEGNDHDNEDGGCAIPGAGSHEAREPSVPSVHEQGDEAPARLSDRLVQDLAAVRTLALRNALAGDFAIAFVAVLHALAMKVFYRLPSRSCLQLTLDTAALSQVVGLADTPWARQIEQRQDAFESDLPKDVDDLWDFLIELTDDDRKALFAHCASFSLNAAVQVWNDRKHAISHADQLGRAIGFDMASCGWKTTVDNYLGRVTKTQILQAVREAKGAQLAERLSHLKKCDMASEAERLLDGTRWLPEPLRLAGASPSPTAERGAADGAETVGLAMAPALADEQTEYEASPQDRADGGDEDRLTAAE